MSKLKLSTHSGFVNVFGSSSRRAIRRGARLCKTLRKISADSKTISRIPAPIPPPAMPLPLIDLVRNKNYFQCRLFKILVAKFCFEMSLHLNLLPKYMFKIAYDVNVKCVQRLYATIWMYNSIYFSAKGISSLISPSIRVSLCLSKTVTGPWVYGGRKKSNQGMFKPSVSKKNSSNSWDCSAVDKILYKIYQSGLSIDGLIP